MLLLNSCGTLGHRQGVLRGSTESQVTCILLVYFSGAAYTSSIQNSKISLGINIVLNSNGNMERKDVSSVPLLTAEMTEACEVGVKEE